MKVFISIIILFLSINTYSQTLIGSQTNVHASLEQYLWSYSKNKVVSEKSLIDFEVMDNWKGMGSYLAVSNDGKYFAYTINKPDNEIRYPLNLLPHVDSLIVQSTNTSWRRAFADSEVGFFSADGQQYIFKKGGSLCFLQLGRGGARNVAGVSSYRTNQKNNWLVYQFNGNDSLIIENLTTRKRQSFTAIAEYNFDDSGDWLVCKNKVNELFLYSLATGLEKRFTNVVDHKLSGDVKRMIAKTPETLQYIDIISGDVKTIYTLKEKTGISSYSLDGSGKQVVFAIVDSANANNNGIWYYIAGMDKAVLKIAPKAFHVQAGSTIVGLSFSDNGHYMQVAMQAEVEPPVKANSDIAGLEVWSHKDINFQSAQQIQMKSNKAYNAIVNLETGKQAFMENKDKRLVQWRDDFVLIKKDYSDLLGDRFWEKTSGAYYDSTWVVDLRDGNAHLLPTQSNLFWFSPSGNYLVYFDANKGCHYFSYDLNTGVVMDISANVPENQLGFKELHNGRKPNRGNLAAWLGKEASVLVYDNYDIWKLDLTGKQAAVNITSGFGLFNRIVLNLYSSGRLFGEIPIIKLNDPLLLKGFNASSKQNGFYKKESINAGAPAELYLGNYFMNENPDWHDGNVTKNQGLKPVKAKNADTWIVQRQSTNDAPNYYQTSDFKHFKRLTDFQPQKNYQWFTEEVVTFKHLDGKTGQGILYKPENFDPQKKYPVLIPAYGAFSNNMNQFPLPAYIDEGMAPGRSPVWFLNNGYLVFTPDVTEAPLKPGPNTFSVIEGAVQYLKLLPYVDANKLGCAFHSRSAKWGSYLLTHSKSFSATALSEGFAYGNLISNQFYISGNGVSRMEAVEMEVGFGNLWEHKDLWLDQTTVLNVDKAVSPLLLLCNKQSSRGDQDQTVQLFTSLRRLEKNVWWLKYDNGEHTLLDLKELKDYTIRYTQFFDHYLKNAPAPQWMTEGIPYKLKGIESRYELDPQGTCNAPNGEPCPICSAWNAQYKRTPEVFKKGIKDWALDKDIADELQRKQNEKRKELDKQGAIQTKQVMRMLNKK